MQHRRRKVAAHPLAERELAHGRGQEIAHLEHLGEARHVVLVPCARNVIDRAQEFERFDQRKIPIQLAALTEDHADVARVAFAFAIGNQARHDDLAGGRDENSGEHLDRRRFSGAIRSDVSDEFAGFERHRHALDRDAVDVFAREERPQRADRAGIPFDGAKDLAQFARLDDGHQRCGIRGSRSRRDAPSP